jgi:ankyrin repeat protein
MKVGSVLVEHGAKINHQNNEGYTSLHYAAENDRFNIGHALLLSKADTTIKDNLGRTPLELAEESENSNMVALFKAGAAADDAVEKQIIQTSTKQLVDDDDDSDSDSDEDDGDEMQVGTEGESPLREAAKHGDLDSVEKILLLTDPDLNLTDSHGDTALTWSCYNNHIHVAEKLIKCGANIEIRNKNGNNALMIATRKGFGRIVKLLIINRANLNHVNIQGFTALLWAAVKSEMLIGRMLVACGAELNATNQWGDTALTYSAFFNLVPLAEDLLMKGADITVRNKEGKTAIDIAVRKHHKEMMALLSGEVKPHTHHRHHTDHDDHAGRRKVTSDHKVKPKQGPTVDTSKPIAANPKDDQCIVM